MDDSDIQAMIQNRNQGAGRVGLQMRANLQQFYLDQGYPPEVAMSMATAEMARRRANPALDVDSPRERIATTAVNDPIAAYREMVDTGRLDRANYGDQDQANGVSYQMTPEQRQQLAEINRQGIRSLSELDPRYGGLRSTLPESEQFRETAPTAQDVAAAEERRRSTQDIHEELYGRPRPFNLEEQRLQDEALAREGRIAGGEQRQSLLDRMLGTPRPTAVGQTPPTYGTPSYPVPTDQAARPAQEIPTGAAGQSQIVPRALEVTSNIPQTPTVPAAPAASTDTAGTIDKVDPVVKNIMENYPNMPRPFFSLPKGQQIEQLGGSPNVVPAGPLAIGGQGMQPTNLPDWNKPAEQSFAPYLMQFSPASMKFSRATEAEAMADAQKRPGYRGPGAGAPAAAPAAQQKTETKPAEQGIFSKIFGGDPYKDMSAAKLMEISAQRPDDPAAFFRADAALRKERPEMFQPQGEKRGGAVEKKPDAVHKALEIIHQLISRG